MKAILAALCTAAFLISSPTLAQEKKEAPGKALTAAQKKQQDRMRDCNEKAADMKGDERKKFMSSCLKGASDKGGEKMTAQQSRMKSCNKEAGDKKLKGDERTKFMRECLKG